jgi:hypothetical protein
MKNFKVLMTTAMLCMVVFSSCSKKDDPGGDDSAVTAKQYFGIKQASIVYDFIGTTEVYFDNYGAKMHIFDKFGTSYIDDKSWILDEGAKKAYLLNDTKKTYQEITLSEVQDKRGAYVFALTDADATAAGYTIAKQTIAGKSCSVYTGTVLGVNTVMAGWNKIYFLMTIDGVDWLRATSFSETVPANMFTLPAGYTKQRVVN